jgi:hypothetical protein
MSLSFEAGNPQLMMDSVIQLLVESTTGYNPEVVTRLNLLESQPGYLTALMQILIAPNQSVAVKMTSAIRLRQTIKNKWPTTAPSGQPIERLSPQDRAAVRAQLLSAILTEQNPTVQDLLTSNIYFIARQDYPQVWNIEIVNPIVQVLTEQAAGITNIMQLFGALRSLYQLLRPRRYALANSKAERAIQNEIVTNTTPQILTILYALLQQEQQCIQSGDKEMILRLFQTTHQILKIFSLHFQQVALPFYKNSQNVNNITACLLQCARTSHLQHALTLYQSEGERSHQHPIVKRRKWAFRILTRLTRGSLKISDKNNRNATLEQVQWNTAWQSGFSEQVLTTSMNVLFEFCVLGYTSTQIKSGTPIPDIDPNTPAISYRATMPTTVIKSVLRILQHFIELKGQKKKFFANFFLPNIRLILQSLASVYVLQEADFDTLEENPTLFIETILNTQLVGVAAQSQADEVLVALFTKKRSLCNVFVEELINRPLGQYQAAMSNPAATPDQKKHAILLKDAAMRVFGITRIFNHPDMIINAFSFLQSITNQHLSTPPEMWPAPPVLELRSLWCFENYKRDVELIITGAHKSIPADIIGQYKEPALDVVLKVGERCVSLLVPSEQLNHRLAQHQSFVGLRIQAASTLDALLNIVRVRDAVLPFSSQLFSSALEMVETLNNERVSVLFQRLLFHYREQIFPFAHTILARLVSKFMELLKDVQKGENVTFGPDGPQINFDTDDNDDDDDDAEEKYWAAVALLSSMHTVLGGISDHPEALLKAQVHVVPLCNFLLDHHLTDYLDEMLVIVQSLTFYGGDDLTDELWSLYSKIVGMIIHGWGIEHFDEALPTLANFFSKKSDQVFTKQIQFQESKDKFITCTPMELLHRLVFAQYEHNSYNPSIWAYQEAATHLFRSHICWLGGESQLPANIINSIVTMYIPKLLSQLLTALCISPHPVQLEDAEKARSRGETPKPFEPRFKYSLLILDCIQSLIFKFPSTLIQMLCTSPAPAEAQVGKQQPYSCLNFILDCTQQVMPTATREQSISINLIGLSTLLQWFSRPGVDNDHQQGSILRTNLVGLLLSAMFRFQEVEDTGSDDEEDDVEFEDDDDDNFGPDDDDVAAEEEASRQQRQLEEYAELASKHAQASHDLYYNDNDFLSPLDSLNFYELFVVSLENWVQQVRQFGQIVEQENNLLGSMVDVNGETYVTNFAPIMEYAQSSRKLFDQEHAECEEEFRLEAESKAKLREQQLQQMNGQQF